MKKSIPEGMPKWEGGVRIRRSACSQGRAGRRFGHFLPKTPFTEAFFVAFCYEVFISVVCDYSRHGVTGGA
jgi:hypothetical protein